MKKLTSLLVALVFAVIFIQLNSCKDDSIPMGAPAGSNAEVYESKSDLKNVDETAGQDVADIGKSEGFQAVRELNSISREKNAFSNTRMNKKFRTSLLRLASNLPLCDKLKNLRVASSDSSDGENDFEFSERTGTYTWNSSSENWDYDKNNPNDKIIMVFPSDSVHRGRHDNNAILTVYYLTYITIERSSFFTMQNGDTISDTYRRTLPTSFSADLKVDRKLVASENFIASWDDKGVPIHVENVLYVKPYTWSLLGDVAPTSIFGSTSLTKENDGTIVAVEGTVNFTNPEKDDIENISGYAQYRDLKVQGDVNVRMIEQADTGRAEPNSEILNEAIKINILHRNRKIGSLYFVDEPDSSYIQISRPVAYIKFNDGSKEKAETYLEAIGNSIEREMNKIDR